MTNAEPTSSQITRDAPAGGVVCGAVDSDSEWPVAGPVIEELLSFRPSTLPIAPLR
jgi:hypothetical protein